MVITSLVAFSLGIGIVFIKEYFDRRVTDPGEVERILGIPEMGSLGKFDNR